MGKNKLIIPFVTSLLFPTLLGLLASWLLNNYAVLQSDDWPLALMFFLGTGCILNTLYFIRRHSKDFAQMVFVSLILRLILAFLFIFVQALLEKQVFFNFAMHFLCYFVFYTIFEIRYISIIINKKPATNEK